MLLVTAAGLDTSGLQDDFKHVFSLITEANKELVWADHSMTQEDVEEATAPWANLNMDEVLDFPVMRCVDSDGK